MIVISPGDRHAPLRAGDIVIPNGLRFKLDGDTIHVEAGKEVCICCDLVCHELRVFVNGKPGSLARLEPGVMKWLTHVYPEYANYGALVTFREKSLDHLGFLLRASYHVIPE